MSDVIVSMKLTAKQAGALYVKSMKQEDEIKNLKQELAALKEQMRWRSVEDELPAKITKEKNPAYVWVIVKSNSNHVSSRAFDPKNQIFTDCFGDEWIDITESVTHWMPLPAP